MDWEAIGALGEVGGAIAVVATLVYLSLQIRNSTKATESEVHASLASEMQRLLVAAAQDDSMVDAMLAAHRNDQLSDAHDLKLRLWFGGFLRVCESHVVQNKALSMDLETPVGAILRGSANVGIYRKIMSESVENRTASLEFLAWLDSEVLRQP